MLFDNEFGGFTPDGREYVIYTDPEMRTPAPWINVIANESAGFTLSEAGGGFSWSQNSSENRLSVWRNDPVTDIPGEAIYLRDEETAAVWSPTPMRWTDLPYLVRHGAGSVIEHQSQRSAPNGALLYVARFAGKFVRIRLKNTAARARRITITYYIEWVLGPLRDMTQQYLVPEFDTDSQTLMVHNPYSLEFGQSYAFVTANQPFHGLTTDRAEFLGRMGNYGQPAALNRIGFSNAVNAGFTTCVVVQLHMDLPIGGEDEICFILGAGAEKEVARQFSQNYRTQEAIEKAWNDTLASWRNILDSVVMRTPDPAMNVLLPWLLYQALSCRIWGRSALYQSGGAYGFRDQLQDVMAYRFMCGLIWRVNRFLMQHAINLRQAMCCIGGIPHQDVAFALYFPMIWLYAAIRRRALCNHDGRRIDPDGETTLLKKVNHCVPKKRKTLWIL